MKNILFFLTCIVLLSCKFESKNKKTFNQNEQKIENLNFEVYGIQINVTDIEEALDFYSGKIRFSIKSQTEDHAELQNDGIKFLLNKVTGIRKNSFPKETRTSLVLHTNNLDSLMISFKNKGIRFVEGKTENGVGYGSICEDPFGNKIALMEQSKYPVPLFKEPKIYNVGYSMNDLENAKQFYCRKLGFYVRTTEYLPALPLGHQDSTFAFMLHKKNVTEAKYYPDETQTLLVFSTKNINSAISLLQKKGVIVNMEIEPPNKNQKLYFITDPFGNISKLVEDDIETVSNKK